MVNSIKHFFFDNRLNLFKALLCKIKFGLPEILFVISISFQKIPLAIPVPKAFAQASFAAYLFA